MSCRVKAAANLSEEAESREKGSRKSRKRGASISPPPRHVRLMLLLQRRDRAARTLTAEASLSDTQTSFCPETQSCSDVSDTFIHSSVHSVVPRTETHPETVPAQLRLRSLQLFPISARINLAGTLPEWRSGSRREGPTSGGWGPASGGRSQPQVLIHTFRSSWE